MSRGKKADHAQQADAAERRAFILEMRRMGGSYRQIAEAALAHFGAGRLPRGWSERYAAMDVSRELERLRADVTETAEAVREIELARLDEMHSRVYPVALGTEEVPPDMRAVDRVLRIMERRAHLLGIDAPLKQEITGKAGGPIEINDTAAKAAAEELRVWREQMTGELSNISNAPPTPPTSPTNTES